jgi:hypothetical protein
MNSPATVNGIALSPNARVLLRHILAIPEVASISMNVENSSRMNPPMLHATARTHNGLIFQARNQDAEQTYATLLAEILMRLNHEQLQGSQFTPRSAKRIKVGRF